MNKLKPGLAIVLLASLSLYYVTLCPTVYTGDSGDFITASYTLGISHPGGYPLYMLLGKAFSIVPIGSIAFRYNLLSAIFAAAAAGLVYLCARRLDVDELPAIGAGLFAAYSRSMWDQATIAEAYALNAMFAVLVTYLLLEYRKDRSPKSLVIAAGAFGLSLTNHVSMVLYIPAFAYLVWEGDGGTIKKSPPVRAALALLAPLILYAYLPLRAAAKPAYNWGNPDNMQRFLRHVTGSVHRKTYALTLPAEEVFERFWSIVNQFAGQLSFSGIFIIAGLYGFGAKNRPFLNFSGLLIGADLGYTLFLNEASIKITTFGLPSILVLCIWGGMGLKLAFGWLDKRKMRVKERNMVKYGLVAAAVIVIVLSNFHVSDRSENLIAYDFANNLIKTVEYDMQEEGFDQAVIFAQGDNIVFPLYYVTHVERPDTGIRVIEQNGLLSHGFYGMDFIWLAKEEHARIQQGMEYEMVESGIPVYYTIKPGGGFPGYSFDQRGLLYRVIGENSSRATANYWELYDYRQVWNTTIELDYMTRSLKSVYYVRFAQFHLSFDKERAAFLLVRALQVLPENNRIRYDLGNVMLGMGSYEKALEQFKIALTKDRDDPSIYNNMGFAYSMLDEKEKARMHYLKAIELDPDLVSARTNLGGLLIDMQAYPAALKQYGKVLEREPRNNKAHFNIGRIHYLQGEYDQAVLAWKNYLLVEPHGPLSADIRKQIEAIESGNAVNATSQV